MASLYLHYTTSFIPPYSTLPFFCSLSLSFTTHSLSDQLPIILPFLSLSFCQSLSFTTISPSDTLPSLAQNLFFTFHPLHLSFPFSVSPSLCLSVLRLSPSD